MQTIAVENVHILLFCTYTIFPIGQYGQHKHKSKKFSCKLHCFFHTDTIPLTRIVKGSTKTNWKCICPNHKMYYSNIKIVFLCTDTIFLMWWVNGSKKTNQFFLSKLKRCICRIYRYNSPNVMRQRIEED